MNKTKNKRILKRILNKSKTNNKKINKTIKNKSSLAKCENFCKKDYMVKMKQLFKKSAEKFNIPYKLPTKEEDDFTYNTCKKTYCNEKCIGYDFFGDKQKQVEFQQKIQNGFQKSYTKDKINILKKRGALSGCVDDVDYK
jgi:hypothetical protein